MKRQPRDPRMPTTPKQYKSISKDITFCMAYFKLSRVPVVCVDLFYNTTYLQFFRNKKLCYESYFTHDLETNLGTVLRQL
jgi:hypothetical protein